MKKWLKKIFHIHKWETLGVRSDPWSCWYYWVKRECKTCGKIETVSMRK